MKTKEKSLRELLADIQKASELERYDPAADLALLAAQYRKMSRWDFGKLLDGMAAKYQNEWAPSTRRWPKRPAPGTWTPSGCTAKPWRRRAAAMR